MTAAVPLSAMLALCCATAAATHGAEPRAVPGGGYDAVQLMRGAALYAARCEICHGAGLTGGEAPPLTGAEFLANWKIYSAGDLLEKVRNTMPPDAANSLSLEAYADIVAKILDANRISAAGAARPVSVEQLKQIRMNAAASPLR